MPSFRTHGRFFVGERWYYRSRRQEICIQQHAGYDFEEGIQMLQEMRAERWSETEVRCIRCDGRMERGTTPVRIEKKGCRASWEALPAWICCRCKSPYFEENEVLLVQCTLALMKQSEAGA